MHGQRLAIRQSESWTVGRHVSHSLMSLYIWETEALKESVLKLTGLGTGPETGVPCPQLLGKCLASPSDPALTWEIPCSFISQGVLEGN